MIDSSNEGNPEYLSLNRDLKEKQPISIENTELNNTTVEKKPLVTTGATKDDAPATVEWNEHGVNTKYLDTRKKFEPEEIEESNKMADYRTQIIGAQAIPVYSAKKTFSIIKTYAQYRNEPVPIEEYNYWKEKGLFVHGMIVLTGLLRRGEPKGKYLNCVEFDNKKGKELVLTGSDGKLRSLEEAAQNTVVEVYGDPNRAHVYFITERPMVSKDSDVNHINDAKKMDYNTIPLVEVHSQNSQMICSIATYKRQYSQMQDYWNR